MEEKERYELHESEKNYIEIFDNVRHIWITEDNICERLNDYEKKSPERIKALEEEIKKLQDRNAWYNIYQINKLCYDKTRAKFDKLCAENQQLKEENLSLQKESIRDNKNWIKEIRQLKQSQKQLAIEELEKVKADINTYNKEHCFLPPEIDSCNKSVEIIDNQIRELEKDELYQQLFINTCKAQIYLALSKARNYIEDILDKALKNNSINEKYYNTILNYFDNQIKELKGE